LAYACKDTMPAPFRIGSGLDVLSSRTRLMTLETYLTDGIQPDRTDIAVIETVLRETASTIAATFNGTHWPYGAMRESW